MSAFFEIYRGVIAGIIGALCIGLGFVIYKQVSDYMDVVALNYARAGLGMSFFILCVLFLNKFSQILSLTWSIVLYLTLSVVFNVLIADTLFFRAQQLIGVSKAFPIVNMTPIFTLFFAHYLLSEPLTERLFIGVIFVISGVYLAARPHPQVKNPQQSINMISNPKYKIGVLLAFIATFSWTFGTICLRVGIRDTDIFVAGMVRYIAVVMLMFPVYALTGNKRRIIPRSRKLLYIVIGGAVLNIMVGGVLFFTAHHSIFLKG